MRNRNLELNTKLRDYASSMQVLQHRSEEDQVRHTYDKDILLGKYQDQTNELLRLKNTSSCLLEQKVRLEE